ncbi:hypothetical protein [Nakamurella lactea]|uniref:hypothetical protein n=1 Tax=Nakamurella lactea TaxID=459515 RepID=UPI0003F72FCD|nr:hypothetical protein [Nakamurella lactea]
MSEYDEEIRAALRRDEALVPDLSAVRREVARARASRRRRNGWLAGGLMAACVLVVSTAVAMAAFRTDNQTANHGADHSAALREVTETSTSASPSSRTDLVISTSRPAATSNAPDRTPAAVPAPPPELVAIPVVANPIDGPLRHCQSQSIAWPVTATGAVNTVALRQAVNECSVGFGNGPTVTARYSLPTLAEVMRSSSLFTHTPVPADVDLDQRVLVVRLDGLFPELTQDGYRPTSVQIYLTATDAQWLGAQDSAPVDPAVFGAPVLPVP